MVDRRTSLMQTDLLSRLFLQNPGSPNGKFEERRAFCCNLLHDREATDPLERTDESCGQCCWHGLAFSSLN